MTIFHSGLSIRRVIAELCLLGSVVGAGLGVNAVAAQGLRAARDFPFNYHQAVRCAGVMRVASPTARPAAGQHTVWTYAMAAGELGRRLGKAPNVVEREVSVAERQARRLTASARRVRTKQCQAVAAAQVGKSG